MNNKVKKTLNTLGALNSRPVYLIFFIFVREHVMKQIPCVLMRGGTSKGASPVSR